MFDVSFHAPYPATMLIIFILQFLICASKIQYKSERLVGALTSDRHQGGYKSTESKISEVIENTIFIYDFNPR